MKIILIGAGSTGRNIISTLINDNHEIVCIDIDRTKIEYIINNFDVLGICGNGSDIDVLKDAGIKTCDMFVATTPNDETNIVCCLIAKKMGVKHTIARIKSPHYNQQQKLLTDLGINLIINPELEVADEIIRIIEIPEAYNVSVFDKGIYLIECIIKEKSKILNKTLHDISTTYKANVLFGAINRNDKIIIPNGNDKVELGDVVYLIGTRESINDFFEKLDINNKVLKNIMIIEGENITHYLLEKINKRIHRIKVFNINQKACEELAGNFPNIQVLNDDGTNQDALINAGLENVDAFVALANLDEENIITSLFANTKKVKKIIMKIARTNLSNMINTTDFSSVVSPVDLIANKIISYVRALSNSSSSSVEKLYKFINQRVEAIEFRVNADCSILNKPLKSIKLIKNTLVAAIIRDDQIIIPNGNSELNVGDQVVVISTNELTDINQIKR